MARRLDWNSQSYCVRADAGAIRAELGNELLLLGYIEGD